MVVGPSKAVEVPVWSGPEHERFRTVRTLGSGGFGVVYEVFDEALSRTVALKHLTRLDSGALYRFKRAFHLLSGVRHPNLTELYELGSHEGNWFYTMELVRGPRLGEYVHPVPSDLDSLESLSTTDLSSTDRSDTCPSGSARTPLEAARAHERIRTALAGLARGLVALHDRGVMHRDIKPANVLVGHDDQVKLLDFELAACVADDDPLVTSNGYAIGTPAYMAPELGTGAPLTPATDWYSVGVLLYQLLTGALPFGRGRRALQAACSERSLEPPSLRHPHVPTDLEELCLGLLRPDPGERLSGREVLERLGAQSTPAPRARREEGALVGRRAELEVLERCLEEVRGGRSVTVAIHGPSGIGKSSIARAFTARCGDALVLHGLCRPRGSVPFNAFDALVDELATLLPRLPPLVRGAVTPADPGALLRLFPVLERAELLAWGTHALHGPAGRSRPQDGDPGPASGGEGTPTPARQRWCGFAALKELLARLAAQRPLVVVIDDVHQMDEDSRSLLAELLAPPGAPAMLLLAVGQRPLDLSEARPPGADLRALEVGPLAPDEARRLAVRASGAAGAHADTILAQSQGSPFLIALLGRHVRGWRGDAEPSVGALVARLPADARAGLEVLALADAPTPSAVVCSAASAGQRRVDPETWSEALAALRDADLVRVAGGAAQCRHDRIVAAVLDTLPLDRRRGLHRALAEALRAHGPLDCLAVARHYRAAGDLPQAAEWAVAAAAEAERSLAFESAADLLRFALQAGSSSAAFELTRRLASALRSAGRAEEAAGAFLAAARLAQADEARELRLRAATVLAASGRFRSGADLFEPLLREAGHDAPPSGVRLVAALLVERQRLSWAGLDTAWRREEDVPAPQLREVDLLLDVGHSLIWDDTLRGLYYHTRALRLALRAGEPNRVCRALSYEVGLGGLRGGPRAQQRCDDLLRRVRIAADAAGTVEARCTLERAQGIAAWTTGRWRAGVEHMQRHRQLQASLDPGAARELTVSRFLEFECLFRLGRVGDIADELLVARHEAGGRGDHSLPTLLTTLATYTQLARGEVDAAERDIEAAVELGRSNVSAWSAAAASTQELVSRTLVALYRGQGALAWTHARALWPAVRRIHLLSVPYWRVTMLHVRARAAIAAATEGVRPRHLLRLVRGTAESLRDESLTWARPLADSMEAAVRALEGDRRGACRLHREAAADFEAQEMQLYATIERLRCGELLGGTEGGALVAKAREWMQAQGIADPVRLPCAVGHWR